MARTATSIEIGFISIGFISVGLLTGTVPACQYAQHIPSQPQQPSFELFNLRSIFHASVFIA
jgi:hypothetical protein